MTSGYEDSEPPVSGIGPELLEAVLDGSHGTVASSMISSWPDPTPRQRAAVAAIFNVGTIDTELLFIQRATVSGDPWSGQMAFPGGRAESSDRDSAATAERETAEELSLDLGPARYLGALGDVDGGRNANRLIQVAAHCYWLPGPPPALIPNHEVARALWVPVSHLLDHDRYIDYWYPQAQARFPGIQLDDPQQVLWGLTLRFLADLFDRLDRPFII